MLFVSQNPATEATVSEFPSLSPAALDQALAATHAAQQKWRELSFVRRSEHLYKLAGLLLSRQDELARLIVEEMGKIEREARSEIRKCAQVCEYYAQHGSAFLQSETLHPKLGRGYLRYEPIGVVLGVMPWNFPFWQVFRFAVPALMAGNGVALKHAPNVPRCAQAVEKLFHEAGFTDQLVTNLFIADSLVAQAIQSPHVHAVTVTGSARAGRAVASLAGAALKKCILELGGSDPFVVLADADLELAASQGLQSRYANCGQTCIAAKRFILVPEIADRFIALLREKVSTLKTGNPMDPSVGMGPLARHDLRENLERQVAAAVGDGATCTLGGHALPGPGWFYSPTILEGFTPQSSVWQEEFFGPVALIVRASDEDDAVSLANDTPYGLGSSLWSGDIDRAEKLGLRIEAGSTFINGLVKSDPAMPFGGTKASGFGRELSAQGIREFTNPRTVWISGSSA